MALELANSCTRSSRLIYLRNEEQANKQGVCCFQADYALRLTVLHPSDTSVLT